MDKLKQIDNFIGEFEKEYPNIYKIVNRLFLKRGLVGKLIWLAGIVLSTPILTIIVAYFFGNKTLSEALEPSPYLIIFSILLVMLAIAIYFTDKSAEKTNITMVNNKPRHKNIQRILDRKISTRLPLLLTLTTILGLSILLNAQAIPILWSAPEIKIHILITILLTIIRAVCMLLSIAFPIVVLTLILGVCGLKKRKVIFLPIKQNLLLEYSQDRCLYLTQYQFTCSKCQTENMRLNRINGFRLQCTAYPEHQEEVDPATFTKYSIPNLSSES